MALHNLTNQTIALAGIAQAAFLVQQLAATGKTDHGALRASIGSILKIDADSVADVFGGLQGVALGLAQLQEQLSGKGIGNADQARYAATLVFLEKQLGGLPVMQQTIRNGVQKAQAQAEQFGLLHENVLANLGDLYFQTISTLQPRIMVKGEQSYLANADTVNKIRALLLAGIRAALLWRQCGGSRWKFLFMRNKLHDECRRLRVLAEAESGSTSATG
ncbi:MAG: high frequency lysogenization protein HflD [Gammaproteobacteria bacterium]